MIESFFTNIKATLYERVRDPLMSTFMVSWLICNYKLFFIFFSDDSLVQKFGFINHTLYQTSGVWFFQNMLLPAGMTLIYLYVLPGLRLRVYSKWIGDNRKMIDAKHDEEKTALLSKEQSDKILLEIYNIKDKADIEKQSLLNKLAIYKTTIDKLQNEVDNKTSDSKTIDTSIKNGSIDDIQQDIFKKIKEYNGQDIIAYSDKIPEVQFMISGNIDEHYPPYEMQILLNESDKYDTKELQTIFAPLIKFGEHYGITNIVRKDKLGVRLKAFYCSKEERTGLLLDISSVIYNLYYRTMFLSEEEPIKIKNYDSKVDLQVKDKLWI